MLNTLCKYAVPDGAYASLMETMGDRIRRLRKARNYSQDELARLVGVTKSAVSQWELGGTSNLKLEPLAMLLRLLNTDLPYLVWGDSRAPGRGPAGAQPGAAVSPRRRA
jgi:transcriptional regulator with XRE-family HTH domain